MARNRGKPNQPRNLPAPQQPQPQGRWSLEAQFSSPLPPAGLLAQYNELVPDAAERILVMVEQQQTHRIALEKLAVSGEEGRANRGQACAFVIALAGLGIGGLLIGTGHDVAGTIFAAADLVGLAGLFIYGNERKRQERNERNQMMSQLQRSR